LSEAVDGNGGSGGEIGFGSGERWKNGTVFFSGMVLFLKQRPDTSFFLAFVRRKIYAIMQIDIIPCAQEQELALWLIRQLESNTCC
jgi:hypothetical protein